MQIWVVSFKNKVSEIFLDHKPKVLENSLLDLGTIHIMSGRNECNQLQKKIICANWFSYLSRFEGATLPHQTKSNKLNQWSRAIEFAVAENCLRTSFFFINVRWLFEAWSKGTNWNWNLMNNFEQLTNRKPFFKARKWPDLFCASTITAAIIIIKSNDFFCSPISLSTLIYI